VPDRAITLHEVAGHLQFGPPRTRAAVRDIAGRRVDTADPAQLEQVGATLARVHRGLFDLPRPDHVAAWGQMGWLLAPAEFLEPYPWIQRAIAQALEDLPDELVTGVVHGDPRIVEFRIDGDVTGLVDWDEVMYAPQVFDVATILSYLDEGTDSTASSTGCSTTTAPRRWTGRAASSVEATSRRSAGSPPTCMGSPSPRRSRSTWLPAGQGHRRTGRDGGRLRPLPADPRRYPAAHRRRHRAYQRHGDLPAPTRGNSPPCCWPCIAALGSAGSTDEARCGRSRRLPWPDCPARRGLR
jgi:hypothetical protein